MGTSKSRCSPGLSSWSTIFLVYINHIFNNLPTKVKLFTDDTSLFSIVNDANKYFENLSNDLCIISIWAYRWKMSFNQDRSKFKEHLKEKIFKAYKGIVVLRKLQNTILRNSLLTIYKSFIHPHLDYGGITYHQPNNGSFCQKIESVQYQAALEITSAIHGTSLTKLYNELGTESMKMRQWFRRLYCFFKIQSSGIPLYLNDLILKPYVTKLYNTFSTSPKF